MFAGKGIIVNSFAIACISAWNDFSQTTIVNCFKKAKISEKDQTFAINDEDDPFKDFNQDLKELREKERSLVPENLTAEDFCNCR